MKYPSVYQGNDYATSTPSLEEGQAPVEESIFAENTVEAQEQGVTSTASEHRALGGGGNTQQPQYFQVWPHITSKDFGIVGQPPHGCEKCL